MRRNIWLIFAVSVLSVGVSRADFKYTQSSKMTGGSLMSMTKTLGVFSKNARQITEPQLTTIMVKGNRMRSEHSSGMVSIIDLEGRRFININVAKKTYSTMTFDDFKAAMQRAEENAQEQMKQQQAKTESQHPEAANLKITPKMKSQETGATRNILDLPTKEVKWQIDMEFESTDPKVQQQAESASMRMNSDAWIAATVPGYDEMRQFYVRMSKELDWLPSMMGSMAGMNAQMGPAMKEFQKNAVTLKGMPLLQTVSFGMAATGVPQNSSAPPPPPPTSDQASMPTSAKDAVAKSLGGMFGGFGKKKKQKDDAAQTPPPAASTQNATSSTSGSSTDPVTVSNSLMEMQIEVTQYSSSSLDKTLFEIPAGYTQVQQDPNQVFGGARRE